jgi:putative hydroxymethylpyrimidine transport system substrate-binding protein
MRRLIALAAAAAALAACGEKQEPTGGGNAAKQPFTVLLDYLPNADHAGIYAAQAAGLYDKAGLKVTIQAPPDPSAPLKLLQAGKADLAISYEPELMLARDAGASDLVSVGALVQKPLTSIIALPASKVAGVKDLAGKRIGTAGIPYQSAYLKTIERKNGISGVKETNVGFNLVPALVAKKVDAILGGFWNYEGVELQRTHRNPVILRMDKLGVPTYDELILVGRKQDFNAAGASRLRRFLQATSAGYRLLKTDPSVGVNALVKAGRGLDPAQESAAVQATLPVFFPTDTSKPWGFMVPGEWAAYEQWMRANGLLKQPPSASPPLTNEFLPGESVGGSQKGSG